MAVAQKKSKGHEEMHEVVAQVERPTTVEVSPPLVVETVREGFRKIPKFVARQDETEDFDEIYRLFTVSSSKYPFVETMSYTSRVPWLKGRPAWIADYASYYKTSKHFIARSLNGKPDYFTQKVAPGDRFNVFKKDREVSFHLVVDLSRCKMWFYAIDLEDNSRFLIKTYRVGLGRFDETSPSGILTPSGKFLLGEKVALYKPGVTGYFQDEEAEMVQIFGTRWIPFAEEIGETSHPAKGYGIHGAPWTYDEKRDEFHEERLSIGQYDSDGCIRLNREEMEELFSIVISKPTVVEIVDDYTKAELPGIECHVKS